MLPWQNISNNIQIMADIKEELGNQEEVRRGGGISLIYLPFFIKNGNHATELSTAGHVISEQHCKSTFDFTEIVNKYGLKRGTICQIVKFISHFSLKLYIKY